MAAKKTWHLTNFAGGIDLREGVFTKDQNRFRELENAYVTSGKKLKRRPGLRKSAGDTASNSQGIFLVGGSFFAVAKKGTTVTHTIAAVTVGTKYFDNPDYCSTWELLDGLVFNGVLCVLIRHTFQGGTALTSRNFLHVFDDKPNTPTFVEDAYCPTNWTPALPTNVYGVGVLGSAFDYLPRMGIAGGKLWIGRPDGNPGFSATDKPRVWNTLSFSDLLTTGERFYFFTPAGLSLKQFTVTANFADLGADQKWAGYVLEYFDTTTKLWVSFTEDAITPVFHAHYCPVTVASRFTGGANEVKLQVYWTGADATLIRFRLLAGASGVSLIQAPVFTIDAWGWLTSSAFSYRYRDGLVTSVVATPLSGRSAKFQDASRTYYLSVGSGSITLRADAAPPSAQALSGLQSYSDALGAFTMNGQLREQRLIQKTITTGAVTTGTISDVQFAAGETSFDFSVAVASGAHIEVNGTRFLTASAGTNNVLIRNTANLAGNYTGLVSNGDSFENFLTAPVMADYVYGYRSLQESQFYNDKLVDYTLNVAGEDDAGFLATSSRNNTGGVIVAISSIRSSIAFHYRGQTQVWQADSDPNQMYFIDAVPFGTGANTKPQPIPFYSSSLLPVVNGLRAFSLAGAQSDSLQDDNLGAPIEKLNLPDQIAGTYWPWMGQAYSAGLVAGLVSFNVLSYYRESKVSAWSTFSCAGVASIGYMTPLDSRLYFLSGTSLYYFDALDTSFRDDNDGVTAYRSRAVWHFNDLDRPGMDKKALMMDVTQTGESTIKFQYVPRDPTQETLEIPLEGTSYGSQRIPVLMTGHAFAPVMESVDDTGWELETIGVDFTYVGRG